MSEELAQSLFVITDAACKRVTPETWELAEFNAHAKFYWPIAGEGRIGLGEQWSVCRPGQVYFIPSYVPLRLTCEAEFEHAYIHFCLRAGERSALNALHEIISYAPQCRDFTQQCFERLSTWMTIPEDAREPGVDLEAQGALSILCAELLKQLPSKAYFLGKESPVIRRCIRFIEDHLSEDLSVERLAAQTTWSVNHFSAKFVAEVGVGPREFVIQRRMEMARRWLSSTDKSVQSIGQELGMADPYYFSRLFKKRNGVSPKVFRSVAWK